MLSGLFVFSFSYSCFLAQRGMWGTWGSQAGEEPGPSVQISPSPGEQPRVPCQLGGSQACLSPSLAGLSPTVSSLRTPILYEPRHAGQTVNSLHIWPPESLQEFFLLPIFENWRSPKSLVPLKEDDAIGSWGEGGNYGIK